MQVIINIPDEFVADWNKDRFDDALHRLSADAHLIAGNYEQETAKMLADVFKNAVQPDPDTVSRQKMINTVNNMRTRCDNDINAYHDLMVTAIEVLPPSPSRPQEPHWISCEERLPEKGVDVLCCRNNKTMDVMHFNPVSTTSYPKGFSMVWDAFSWRQDNVIAWMPLPEAYREGES